MKPSLFTGCAVALMAFAVDATAQDAGPDTITVEGQLPDPVEAAGPQSEVLDLEAMAGASGSESVISYTPDYFRPFSPTHAQDMVNRIPGFSASSGGSARGFGQNAGNVLINGERPSARNQNVSDILQRIPVSEVVRIDLIRGQTAGIDMSGHTVVVNVIRRVTTRSSGTWQVQSNWNTHSGKVAINGSATRIFSFLGANVSAGISMNRFPQGQWRDHIVYDAFGDAVQMNYQNRKGGPRGYNITFAADRTFGEWSMNLNGRFSEGGFRNAEYSVQTAGETRMPPPFTAPYQPYLRYAFETNQFRNDQTQWELGGDLERPIASNLRLKIIVLQSMERQRGSSHFATWLPTGFNSELASESRAKGGETILRSFVTWTPGSTYSIETGAEIAYNFRDSSSIFPAAIGPVPISDTKVEELRGEPYVTALWRPRSDLSFNASLQAEVSELKQSGDAQQTRSFFYPKGSASMTWDALSRTQFRFTLERTVGQLSFGDFASSVNFSNETQDIGNPNLVPEQTWTARAVAEQRFWDDGVASLQFTRDWISDAQGLVPLGGGREGPGSLGDADRWNVRASVDAPLARLGLAGARLQATYQYGGSSVIDPVTGEKQRLPGWAGEQRSFSLGFRSDHPVAGFSWGWNYSNNSGAMSWRLNEIQTTFNNQGGISAFVETTRFFGVNTRLQVGNIGRFYFERNRYLFAGPRDTAPLAAIERRREFNELMVNFRVRGTF